MRLNDFIVYKRSLGYDYKTAERYLNKYRSYMSENYPDVLVPDKDSTDSFLNLYQGQSGGLHNAMAPLREFSRYLYNLGLKEAYIIPAKQMPKLNPDPPYFLSEEEISLFFNECDSYYNASGKYPSKLVIPAFFRFLYCCGVRPKEGRTLLSKNINLEENYIDILQSKGPVSRRLFISNELADYLTQYDRHIRAMFPNRKYFFPSDIDRHYSVSAIVYHFQIVWKTAFPEWIGKYPRLYDFRHHFAWATINSWVREGVDVNAMLPYLMRYMGHNCIKHTLYYFRFVPDFYNDYQDLAMSLNDRIPEVSDE